VANRLTGSATGQTLQVKGLSALQRDLNKIAAPGSEKSINQQLMRPALKEIGDIVAEDARRIARRRFTTLSKGTMARKIAGSVTQQGLFVQSKATRKSRKYPDGYRYPGVYEYGGRDVQLLSGGGMTEIRRRSRIGANLRQGGRAQGEFGEYGPNAVLYPALVNKFSEVERQFVAFSEKFLRDIGLN
jgi:hypothetical protein